MMNPGDLPFDLFKPAAGRIVVLGQVFFEHPLAELRLIPGNMVSFGPGKRNSRPMNQVQ